MPFSHVFSNFFPLIFRNCSRNHEWLNWFIIFIHEIMPWRKNVSYRVCNHTCFKCLTMRRKLMPDMLVIHSRACFKMWLLISQGWETFISRTQINTRNILPSLDHTGGCQGYLLCSQDANILGVLILGERGGFWKPEHISPGKFFAIWRMIWKRGVELVYTDLSLTWR